MLTEIQCLTIRRVFSFDFWIKIEYWINSSRWTDSNYKMISNTNFLMWLILLDLNVGIRHHSIAWLQFHTSTASFQFHNKYSTSTLSFQKLSIWNTPKILIVFNFSRRSHEKFLKLFALIVMLSDCIFQINKVKMRH